MIIEGYGCMDQFGLCHIFLKMYESCQVSDILKEAHTCKLPFRVRRCMMPLVHVQCTLYVCYYTCGKHITYKSVRERLQASLGFDTKARVMQRAFFQAC